MLSGNTPAVTPDRAPHPQKALKYRYDSGIEEWTSEECVVMMARKPFAEGGMRVCYKMYEIDQEGKHAPGVAKVFKDDAFKREEDDEIAKAYFDECMTQTVADSFARQWNELLGDSAANQKFSCMFLPVRVMQFDGKVGRHSLCNCEPYLQGDYIKHNDNDGNVETNKEVPQSFSHFTWVYSNQLLLVCDIQGVDNYFTDPQIHSHDGKSFGMGNLGQAGIDRFLRTHKCNSMCRKMGLVPPERNPDGTWRAGKNAKVSSDITKQSFSSEMIPSGSAWTANKYDGAVTQAITRVTKRRDGAKVDSAVEITQLQLAILQEKLAILIQQHGSNNPMLLSPQRQPRKPPPNQQPLQRPWSPDPVARLRSAGTSANSSPGRRPESPPGRSQSPVAKVHSASFTGGLHKMSSSYDLDEDEISRGVSPNMSPGRGRPQSPVGAKALTSGSQSASLAGSTEKLSSNYAKNASPRDRVRQMRVQYIMSAEDNPNPEGFENGQSGSGRAARHGDVESDKYQSQFRENRRSPSPQSGMKRDSYMGTEQKSKLESWLPHTEGHDLHPNDARDAIVLELQHKIDALLKRVPSSERQHLQRELNHKLELQRTGVMMKNASSSGSGDGRKHSPERREAGAAGSSQSLNQRLPVEFQRTSSAERLRAQEKEEGRTHMTQVEIQRTSSSERRRGDEERERERRKQMTKVELQRISGSERRRPQEKETEEEKRKEMIHQQMLGLKQQLEAQLQRLQSTALMESAGSNDSLVKQNRTNSGGQEQQQRNERTSEVESERKLNWYERL